MNMQPYDPGNPEQGYSLSDDKVANINNPDKVLDISGRNEDDGAPLIAWEYNGQDNQQWTKEYI